MNGLDRGKMEYFKWLEDQQDLAANTSYLVNGYDDNPRYYFWFQSAKILRNALADFADEREDYPVMMTSVMSVDGECTVTGNDPEHVAAFENLLKRKGYAYSKNRVPLSSVWQHPITPKFFKED